MIESYVSTIELSDRYSKFSLHPYSTRTSKIIANSLKLTMPTNRMFCNKLSNHGHVIVIVKIDYRCRGRTFRQQASRVILFCFLSVVFRVVTMSASTEVAVINKRPRANTAEEIDEVIILLNI